jgi:glutathione synthase
VGGSVVATTLTAREREICAVVGARCKAAGLVFVGLDVIGDHLTEVNVTSPTGIREVLALGGHDIADEYVQWCERNVRT